MGVTRATVTRAQNNWWCVFDGETAHRFRGTADLLDAAQAARWRLSSWSPAHQRRVLRFLLEAGGDPFIALRGATSSAPVVGLVGAGDWCVWDGSSLVPSDAPGMPADEVPASTVAACEWAEAAWKGEQTWRERIAELAGVPCRDSLGTTAAGACPEGWRKASRRLSRTEAWQTIRRAYYGGRVTCRQPGWRGEAVEYDLVGAYGAALAGMLGKVPDVQTYAPREPLPDQPAWYDCDVQLRGEPGPLPVRDPERPWRLTYPESGTHSGVWTREDLERPGVTVVKVRTVISGRWSSDLAPHVSRWLALREASTCETERAILRLLCNALAGKLAQRPLRWELWQGEDEPPAGAVPLDPDFAAFAVPVIPDRWPLQVPQAASYVTARVRSLVWPELARHDAIYSDTDSVHLPASAPPPANVGTMPGQWQEKARGPAVYKGPKRYSVGAKRVGTVDG